MQAGVAQEGEHLDRVLEDWGWWRGKVRSPWQSTMDQRESGGKAEVSPSGKIMAMVIFTDHPFWASPLLGISFFLVA